MLPECFGGRLTKQLKCSFQISASSNSVVWHTHATRRPTITLRVTAMFARAARRLAPTAAAAAAATAAATSNRWSGAEPDYALAAKLQELAGRARASLEEPPAVMRRCARANWREYAGAAAVSKLERSQDALKRAFQEAAQAWKASGGETLAPSSVEVLEQASAEAEAAVIGVRNSAISTAAAVPWHQVMAGTKLVRADGQRADGQDAVESLAGKVVGLYFTASWCGPCHRFSPHLVALYDKIKSKLGGAANFEVVVVGWDEAEADRQAYARNAGMKWLSLPHEPRALADELTLRYGVQYIPCLVVVEVSADGKEARVLARDGRQDVEASNSWRRTQQAPSWLSRVQGAE